MYALCEENESLQSCLLRMQRTGKYAPDAKWIIPRQGQGMVMVKSAAAWRLMVNPSACTRRDIETVYFAQD